MTITGLMVSLAQAQVLLAQAGVPTGQDENHEGWGGMIGIGVILLAVWMTIMIIRGLSGERDDAGNGDSEAGVDDRTSKDERRQEPMRSKR